MPAYDLQVDVADLKAMGTYQTAVFLIYDTRQGNAHSQDFLFVHPACIQELLQFRCQAFIIPVSYTHLDVYKRQVNGAIVVGYKLAGLAGVLTSVLATVIPPFVILSVISLFYAAFRSNLVVGWMLNGMQAGVGAVIAQVVWEMGGTIVKTRQWISVCIMVAAFAANYVFRVNVILIILICALIGVVRTCLLYTSKLYLPTDSGTFLRCHVVHGAASVLQL